MRVLTLRWPSVTFGDLDIDGEIDESIDKMIIFKKKSNDLEMTFIIQFDLDLSLNLHNGYKITWCNTNCVLHYHTWKYMNDKATWTLRINDFANGYRGNAINLVQ